MIETGLFSLQTLQESGRSDSWSGSHAPESDRHCALTRATTGFPAANSQSVHAGAEGRSVPNKDTDQSLLAATTATVSRAVRSVEHAEENTEEEERPAKGRQCNECKKTNHFANMCRTKTQYQPTKYKPKRVHTVTESTEQGPVDLLTLL